MKRGKRKACQLFLLAVCMLLLGAAMPVKAEEWTPPPTSGTCGADITWKYEPVMVEDRERNALVLTGSGAMTDEYLKKVTYEEGGTWHYNAEPPWMGQLLYGIKLDSRITTIGDGAFGHTHLCNPDHEGDFGEEDGTLVVPENVTSIGKLAFANARLGAVYIGPKVTKVGEQAFFDCSMKHLYVANQTLDFSQAPLIFGSSALETIHAPKGSKAEAYAKANGYVYEEWDGTDYGKTSYTLTLDAGEGAFLQTAQSARYTVSADRKTAVREVSIGADSVPVPDIAPALEGKYFGGWYLGNDPFVFEKTALRQDTRLTAKWLEEPTAPVLQIENRSEWSAVLSWEMRMDEDLRGYRVYRADTADAEFVKITENDLSAGSVSYTDHVVEKDILKKQAYRYYIEAVYETGGTEKSVRSNEVSCNSMIYNASLIEQTDGVYVGVRLTDKDGKEVSSLVLHEGETSGELFFSLVKKDGTTVSWQEAMPAFSGSASIQCGLGLPYPVRFPLDSYGGGEEPFAYATIPVGYLYDASCTRLKGLKTTAGQELNLYVGGQPGFLTAIPVIVEAAEPGVTYPSYDDKEGIVTDDLQTGLQILRDAVRNRVNDTEVYIKKSACDPSIAAYRALRDQDPSDNPSGDPRGGLIPEWVEAELYDINKGRAGMKPWEGDYAYYSMRAGSLSADLEYPDQIYGEDYYKLVLEVNQFTTTLEQEAAVDAKVKELLNGRLAGVKGKSEYERAKAVYDFVSTSMHYDNSDPVHHYAYGGLCKGKATCMGFALSFQRLSSELGLENKVIMGLDAGAHTYNLVKIRGKYYYLDCSAKKFLKGKKNFKTAPLQDRYLSTAFQTYFMAQIASDDYAAGQEPALDGIAVRALTDGEISQASGGAFTGIADRTSAKYELRDTVIQAALYDREHPLKPVYYADEDKQEYVLAFRLTVDREKFDENGTVQIFAGEADGHVFTKADSTLKDGYLDLILPIGKGDVSITIDYDTADEGKSQYEAVTYTMDFSRLVRESVRASGSVQESTDAMEETGIELSGPSISYRENDREVTVLYEAVAWSSQIRAEGIADTAGNYAVLRMSAPEAMLGTKVLSESTASSADCTLRWEKDKKYLDCLCKMEKGKENTLTIQWAGKETQTQTVILRAAQDCYMETDGAGMDAPKKVAFNGLPSTLYVGQSQIADVKVTRAYERDRVQLSYTSDDSSIFTVNRVTGELRALRPGKATLTVRAAGLDRKGKVVSASKKITVKELPVPSGVKITEVKDVSAAAVWKKNTSGRWMEGYAVPYTDSLGTNAKAWKAAVEAALTEAGLDNGMPENMTDEQRQNLEKRLSETLCPGVEEKVVAAGGLTADGSLAWESGLHTNTFYVFYLRNMTENAVGEVSCAGWMSGRIQTKMPVFTKIQLTAYGADKAPVAFNDQDNSGYIYTDPKDGIIPKEVRYELSAAGGWQNEKDIIKSPSYKSTNPKVVKVSGKGMLSLGGQAGTAEIYVTGKDSGGAVRESNRIRIRVVKSPQGIQDKTTTLTLGQSVSVQELVGSDVKGAADACKLDRVDLAAMVDELEQKGKDCFAVTYPAGEKEKAVITPFAYPVDEKSGERKKGAGLSVSVKLYDKTGEGRQLVDTKNAVIKVNDMSAPAVSKVAALDTAVEITFKPNAVVQEINGARYYYTLTLTNKNTGESSTYRAGSAGTDGSVPEGIFTYVEEPDKKGQKLYRCQISGLASATGYEAVVTAHYLAESAGNGTKAALEAKKDSGVKKFTTLKPVIAAQNSMKVSLVSMSELWADANAVGREITHDETVALANGQTYVLFAQIDDYDRIMGTDSIKWSVVSDPKGAAVIKASSDSYTAKLALERCGTVKVQAVSSLSKKVVCSFTVEVKPYQSNTSSAQAGGN